MRRPFLALALAAHHLIAIDAFLTYQSMRNLTALTDDCRERIDGERVSGVGSVVQVLGLGQVVFGGEGRKEGNEVEATVAAALKLLCSDLLIELEKPETKETSETTPKCQTIIIEYHAFLGATVKFLHTVQERQMLWHWDGESAVFEGVGWLQGLWASRETNKQHRSFIEQQMLLYDYKGSKSCFGSSEEVLHRDVEIVEYMNDLIDSFT